jgi:hypothetical protein
MRNAATGIVVFVILMGSLKATGQETSRLLPAAEELTGWKISRFPEVFTGDNLFDLINGGADIYFEYGFNDVVSAQYTDPSLNIIQVEIYHMTDASSAYGIFSITQQTVQWSEDYGNLSAVNQDYISFWKDRYYVNISWSSRQRIDPPLLAKLANLITGKISGQGDYPELVRVLQTMDLCKKSVFLKGNIALSNLYYFDYKDVFKINEAVACSPGGYHSVIIKYSDQASATEVMADAKQSVSNNKRFSDLAIAFQGFSCSDNKGNPILIRQIDKYIVILIALDAGIALIPLMDDITLKIENGTK